MTGPTSPMGASTPTSLPEDLASIEAVLGRLAFADAGAAAGWRDLLAFFARHDITAAVRTRDVALRDWVDDTDFIATDWQVAACGVALADLVIWDRFRFDFTTVMANPQGPSVARHLRSDLLALGAHGPDDLRLPDAIGWLLVGAQSPSGDPALTIRRWYAAGLGHQGWLYAAAGLSPDEVAAGLGDGSLDEGRARVMAGLRGVVLPVG